MHSSSLLKEPLMPTWKLVHYRGHGLCLNLYLLLHLYYSLGCKLESSPANTSSYYCKNFILSFCSFFILICCIFVLHGSTFDSPNRESFISLGKRSRCTCLFCFLHFPVTFFFFQMGSKEVCELILSPKLIGTKQCLAEVFK